MAVDTSGGTAMSLRFMPALKMCGNCSTPVGQVQARTASSSLQYKSMGSRARTPFHVLMTFAVLIGKRKVPVA